VTFDPPVTPGKRSIGLRPVRNLRFSGVYLFGVTAYPVGEKSHGQFLGFGRLHFYGGGSRPFVNKAPMKGWGEERFYHFFLPSLVGGGSLHERG